MLTAKQNTEAGDAIGGRATRLATRSDANRTRGNGPGRVTPAIGDILVRVQGEYREMPGLSLTVHQAARLWGLDCDTCELVLTTLIERRVLARGLNGAYIRRSSG